MKSSTSSDTFIDTSGFYALMSKKDGNHAQARSLVAAAARKSRTFVTTDYILDETATLLKARGLGYLTASLFEIVFASAACRIEWMDVSRFAESRRFFHKHQDQAWSFTDCFSFVLMRELKINEAMTTDKHFNEAGFRVLLG